jgi:hypothetical protein
MNFYDLVQQFELFLKEHNCYNDFINNNSNRTISYSDYIDLLKKCPEDVILYAFSWYRTSNSNFWSNLNRDWVYIYYNYLKKGKFKYFNKETNLWTD